jgi:uncharacterized protein YabN with tetrapyrrole methylase and pyrophosphatase domain
MMDDDTKNDRKPQKSEEKERRAYKMRPKTKKSPFHEVEVTNGVYGELSKVQEELDEAEDAEKRGQDLLLLIELSDVIGACAGVAEKYGMSLDQLIKFSEMVREVKAAEAAQARASLEEGQQLLEAAKDKRREMAKESGTVFSSESKMDYE